MAKYGLSKYLTDALEVNAANLTTGYDASQVDYILEAMGVSGRVELTLWAMNNLERMDPILEPIILPIFESEFYYSWSEGNWKKGNANTRGESGKRYKRRLSVPADFYDYELELSRNDVKRMSTMSARHGMGNNPMIFFEKELMNAVDYFKKLQRKLALKALTELSTDESPTLPQWYRDTSGFASSNQIIPPRNGELVFTNAETHYLAQATYSENMLYDLIKKIKDKSPGTEVMPAVIANETSWKTFLDQFDNTELEKFVFQRTLGMEDLASNNLMLDAVFIKVPDSDMPTHYFLAVDATRQSLAKREHIDESLRGVQVDFNTLGKIMELRNVDVESGVPMSVISEYNNEIEKYVGITGAIKFKIEELGYGVIDPSAGAVLYANGASYVSPTWTV